MNSTWEIRQATLEDAIGLRECMKVAYAIYQPRMGGGQLPPMQADYANEIKHYPCWVVESAGLIIGGLIMVFEKDHANIANIAINPSYQGKGIGGALMQLADNVAIKKGFSELALTTHTLLTENIALYEHLGWVETDRKNDKVFMKKTLKSTHE